MLQKEIKQIWEDNILSYSAAVNQSRAIPDARTGLKPIHRKILYEMYADKILSTKKFKKCAYMVGQIIARFSEHGDGATYDALTRLAQPWIQRYPLLEFHGNVGSQFGDSPAAMRYSEARLAPLTEEGFLATLKKDTVDWTPNFTNEENEPLTLPALFPGLFCLPNQGIGYAVAANFLTYNLYEVSQMIINYINTGKLSTIYYDLASGGTFINPQIMEQIYKTGKGSIIIDAKYEIEKDNKIVFTELPFNVMMDDVIDAIAKLCDSGQIIGVKKIYNDSGKNKLRLVVEIEKNANLSTVIEQLFQKSALRSSYGINQVALIDNQPKLLTMKDMVEIYIKHNIECIKREYEFEFSKNAARIEILKGLQKALEDIDNVVQLIRNSANGSVAKSELIKKYNFSENQAKAILDMKLARLANLEKIEVNTELNERLKKDKDYTNIIQNTNKQKEILIQRLTKFSEKYKDDRRTKVEAKEIKKNSPNSSTPIITPEKCVVVMTEGGTIKRIAQSSFRNQKRKGKGIKTQSDITSSVIRTNTVDSLMLFTNLGNMYRLTVNDIPSGTNASKGTPISSLIQMEPNEKVNVIYSIYKDTEADSIFFVTERGTVKKTALKEYINTKKKNGVQAIKLREGDQIAAAFLVKDEDVFLLSSSGMGILFNSKEIGLTARNTIGVKGIKIKDDEKIISAIPIHDKRDNLAIILNNGIGKKISLDEIPHQARGGKGLSYSKEPNVKEVMMVADDDNILLVGDSNSLCISAKDIPLLSRAAIGNLLIKTNGLKSATKI